MNVVKAILLDWIQIFKEIQGEKIDKDTFIYQKFANSCHKEIKQFLSFKSKIEKGFFGSTFAGQEVEKDALDNSDSKTPENEKNDNKKRKNNKRWKHIKADTAIACRGCGRFNHYHFHCFYLFP